MTAHQTGKLSEALAYVEGALAELWTPEPGQPPKARTCTANLVVLTAMGQRKATLELLDKLNIAEVARTFLVAVDPRLPPWAMSADVSARCQKDGEKLICSERIDLMLGTATAARVDSIVSSLSLAEVPRLVLLLDAVPSQLSLPVIRGAAQVVIDSDVIGLEAATQLGRETSANLVDLAWERLLPMRSQIAGFFDDERLRAAVTAIRKLSVVTTPTEGATLAAPARLIIGWLASRLGWRFNAQRRATDALHGPVTLELDWQRSSTLPAGALLRVAIEAELGDARAELSVQQSEAGDALIVERTAEEIGHDARNIALSQQRLTSLIDRALLVPQPDVVVRQTLLAAASYPPLQSVPPSAG